MTSPNCSGLSSLMAWIKAGMKNSRWQGAAVNQVAVDHDDFILQARTSIYHVVYNGKKEIVFRFFRIPADTSIHHL